MTEADLPLEQGPAHALAEWEKAAADVLRKSRRLTDSDNDSDVWDKLARTTLDGIKISPLGTPEQLAGPTEGDRPDRRGAWDVRSLISEPGGKAAAEAALNDLENGVTSLWIRVGSDGVPVDQLETTLAGVLLDVAPVVLDAPDQPLQAAQTLARIAGETKLAAGSGLGLDPIGMAARGEESHADITQLAQIANTLGARLFVVDGTAVHDQGASDAQELGYVLAAGVHYLRRYADHGVDPTQAAQGLEFRLSATAEQFPTIAKFRALRRLWGRVLELSGVPQEQRTLLLHGVTSRPMMAKYDPWVNMLRTTVAAFAAGVGGADSVTVLPYDQPLGLPDPLSRRNARNTSALLIEESHVAKVSDPAGGSYAVEKLTNDLAEAGWAEFTRIEAEGDILEALPSLLARVAEVAQRRDAEVARRRRPLTGVSEFPNLHETLPTRAIHPGGSTPVRRYGWAFEELRDNPVATPVFLATLGTVAAHTARATFISNLLAAGGIDVVNPGAHESLEALLASYTGPDGGQPVVCLVGNDAAYADTGAQTVSALREAGAKWVIVAGKPGDLGVDDSAAMGVDALDFLARTREQLR